MGSDIETFHGAIDITRASTTMTRRRDSDMDTASIYEGDWKEGIKEGSGKFTYANGDVFTGPYVGGNRHGSGQLVKSDGEERNENYKEGKLVNFTVAKSAE